MRRLFAVLIAGAAFAAGCSPNVFALTPAPPMRIAELDSAADTIDVSEGVAMAFECRDGFSHGPCDAFRVESRDPSIATVHLAHVDPEHGAWSRSRPEALTSFVLVGIKPGNTVVTTRSGKWSRDYQVTVEAAGRAEGSMAR